MRWTFLKKMVLGVPVRFTRIRCKKRGCNKRKPAQVTSIKAQIRLIFRDRLVCITVAMLGYDWWLCMVINIKVYSIAVGFSPTLYC